MKDEQNNSTHLHNFTEFQLPGIGLASIGKREESGLGLLWADGRFDDD
jgi:hypothetical protein